jgi:hypothetical protein
MNNNVVVYLLEPNLMFKDTHIQGAEASRIEKRYDTSIPPSSLCRGAAERKRAERQAVNTLCQASAADLVSFECCGPTLVTLSLYTSGAIALSGLLLAFNEVLYLCSG